MSETMRLGDCVSAPPISSGCSICSRSVGSIAGMDRLSFRKGKPGRVAIALPLQASRVIALMLGVSQCLGFSGTQLGIITGFLAVLTGRQITLVFRVCCLPGFRGCEFGVITLVPTALTILCVALVFCGDDLLRFQGS